MFVVGNINPRLSLAPDTQHVLKQTQHIQSVQVTYLHYSTKLKIVYRIAIQNQYCCVLVFLKILSGNLCLLVEVFKTFTFSMIIDVVKLKPIILLFVFHLSHLFSVTFPPLFLPSLVCFYNSILSNLFAYLLYQIEYLLCQKLQICFSLVARG